ncbi:hypothetical protein DFO45_2656 [Azorhizobium sp. AG788]|uniref:hypothetical protein n=1 Tax=Azorhizobium sp. AG788 TaxID=2183897 RepID=UPI00105C83D3|nr:hypothetical protein [Azorhizobium sp. AG788]TDT94898.1 hypothetical protein DFO45_2656 [Azorhizobium sp. AG788]
MSLTSHLIQVEEAFRRGRKISRARLSSLLFNDGKRLGVIAGGGDLQTRNYERAMCWLSANWPEGAEWPEGVARPVAGAPDEQAGSAQAAQEVAP